MDVERTETELTERKVVRRGLLAGFVALGAAVFMKSTGPDKGEAADGGALIMGSILNTATQPTTFNTTGFVGFAVNGATGSARAALRGSTSGLRNAGVSGINDYPGGIGVQGETSSGSGAGTGVEGISGKSEGNGVRGVHFGGGTGVKGVNNLYPDVESDNGTGTGPGVWGKSGSGDGVRGESASGVGVRGAATGNGAGLKGFSNIANIDAAGDGSGPGVWGKSGNGDGVRGESASGVGVRGAATGNGTGLKGYSNASNINADGDGTGIGVNGKSGAGIGVKGQSIAGIGIYGQSDSQPGVHGVSTYSLGVRGVSTSFVGVVGISTGSHGLYGSTSAVGGIGVVCENTAGGMAALFTGSVQVYGNLQVFGAKNAVIKMQDGTNAAVYCQESPEPYFEDFGRAQLQSGAAHVAIEREFAQLVAGRDYMVFLTPHGDTRGLFVSRQDPTGFEVRESQGGVSNVPFSYRIVTRRKDIEGRRFARVSDEAARNVAATRALVGAVGPAAAPNGVLPVNPLTITPQPGPQPSNFTPVPGTGVQQLPRTIAPNNTSPAPGQPGPVAGGGGSSTGSQ